MLNREEREREWLRGRLEINMIRIHISWYKKVPYSSCFQYSLKYFPFYIAAAKARDSIEKKLGFQLGCKYDPTSTDWYLSLSLLKLLL